MMTGERKYGEDESQKLPPYEVVDQVNCVSCIPIWLSIVVVEREGMKVTLVVPIEFFQEIYVNNSPNFEI